MVDDERSAWLARNILPHEPALRFQIRRWRLPEGLDVDDVVQESYAKLAAREDVSDIRAPKNYLFQIARSIILMHLRRSRVVSIQAIENLGDLALAADEPTVETQVSDREQLRLLAQAVADLPETSRTAFLLRTVDELSHREIGARLGMSVNAVQKNLAKSLLMLMSQLGRGGNQPAQASSRRGQEDTREDHVDARNQRRD